MRITIHRGSREVGGNCIELQAGTTRIILDVGMRLFDNRREPFDRRRVNRMTSEELEAFGIVPQIEGLFSGTQAPDAILLTHAHLDHVGLLPRTVSTIPVYASVGTSKMMLAGEVFANQACIPRERFKPLLSRIPKTIGDFRITPFSVDHSIFGSLAFLIEGAGKRLLYTGDLRLHGMHATDHEALFASLNNLAIDALLVEGTHFGLDAGKEKTESQLQSEILQWVREAESLVIAAFSPQHMDRLRSFIVAAKETGRTFVADPYTAFILYLAAGDAGILNPLTGGRGRVYYPQSLRAKIARAGSNKVFELYRNLEIDMAEIKANPQ